MITGYVNSKLEAMVSLSVYSAKGEMHQIEALLDTGYSAFLTLPTAIITRLELENFATGELTLADGSKVTSDLYQATIIWDGQPRVVEVDTLESEVLAGMALLEGCDLHVRIAAGEPVTITSFRQTTGE